MPAGRPSEYDNINFRQLEILVKRGWTDAQLAEFYGVCRDTINEWKTAHPEFSDSIKSWKEDADENIERSLYERALGYEHPEDDIRVCDGIIVTTPTIKHYPPDTTAAIFWLKNRQPAKWRDKQEIDQNHKFPGLKLVLGDGTD